MTSSRKSLLSLGPARRGRMAHGVCLSALAWLLGGGVLHAAPPSGAGWCLAWNDEFEGSTLDTAKWRHWLPGARRDAVNTSGAVAVGDGTLTISTFTSGGAHYTGMISTQDTYPFSYGYVEARINYDGNPGMWSAFWMQSPTMGNPVGSPNSAGTEIDICEHRKIDGSNTNREGNIGGVIHWDGYGADHKSVGYDSGNLGLGSGFHIYGMEWSPDQQRFYIDGVLRWTVTNASTSPVSQRSEFIILSSEVDQTGTTWAGAIPAAGYGTLATTTAKMEVDYVRVYQRAETVVNGDFEGRLAPFGSTNQAGWSATGGRTDPAAARIAPTTSAGASVQQTVRGLLPATDYVLSGWGNAGATAPQLLIGAKSHGGADVSQTLTTGSFAKATVPFTTGATNRTASVFASSTSVGSTAYADDFLLRRARTVNNGQLESGDALAWSSVYGGAFVSADGTNYGGAYAWKIPASSSSAGAEQDIAGLTPNTSYRLTGWTTNGNTGLAFGVKNHGAAQVTNNVLSNTWTRASVNFTTGATTTTATIFAYRASSAQTSYADAFFLAEPLASPWADLDVGTPPLAGIAGRLGDKFTLQACGANISGASDKMHFIYQTVSGDATITARIVGVDTTAYYAKAGVMIRESTAEDARGASLTWGPVNQLADFNCRATTGGTATSATTAGEITTPPWVRLTRRGNTFSAFTSPDGLAWTRVGTPQTIPMASSVRVGLPACSGDSTRLVEAALDNVTVGLPVPDVLITAPADGTTVVANASGLRLAATVTDSGTPAILWSKVSGPGSATFANANLTETSATFSAPGKYLVRCAASTAAGTGSDDITVHVAAAAAADSTLVMRLKLDESSGTVAVDSSGNANHGTTTGGITWQPADGELRGAAAFNGTDSFITVPDNPQLDNTSAFTLCYWFKANTFNGAGLVAKRVSFNDNNAYGAFLTIDGKLNVDIDSNNNRFTSATTFNRGAWYHIALVFDGSLATAQRAKLFVNGALDTTAGETSTTIPNYNSPLYIGILSPATTAFFDGLIDDVRFLRRALTAAEILALKNGTDTFAPPVIEIINPAGPVALADTADVLRVTASASANGASGSPVIAWSMLSGPVPGVFGNAATADTTVIFSAAGSYVIRCTTTTAAGSATADASVAVAAPATLTLRQGDNGYSHTGTFIRSDVTTWNSGARDQMLVGRSSGGYRFRTLLSFPLTGVPVGASISSVSLDLWTDTQAGTGNVGALELRELTATPVEGTGSSSDSANINGTGTGATWVNRTTTTPWTTAGGDYAAATLATLAGFSATATNTQKTFPSGAVWVAAAQAALTAGQALNLMVISPETEIGPNNQYARLSSDDSATMTQRPRLNLTWNVNPAPVVNPGTAPGATTGIPATLTPTVDGATSTNWSLVSGPGTAVFGDPAIAATTVTFGTAGTYQIRLAAANSSGEVSRFLTLNVADPPDPADFTGWQAITWPGVTDPAIIGQNRDPDGDQIVNLLEWALHLDARLSDRLPVRLTKSGTLLEFTYTRRKSTNALFTVEWSDSPANPWSPSGTIADPPVTLTSTSESVRVTLPAGSSGRRFVRLKVTQP